MDAPRMDEGQSASLAARKDLHDLERRSARIVEEYDSQGDHRTGSKTDTASARWLARWVRRSGSSAQFEDFKLARIEPVDCGIEIDGRRIGGVPLFDGGFTDAEGISAKLGFLGEDCDIAIEEVFHSGVDGKAARKNPAGYASHRAVVRLTQGAQPGLVLANAPAFLKPSALPTLQVSGGHADWLKAMARSGAKAKLTAHVRRRWSTALNVNAMVAGTKPGLPPVIVSTPRSGWWNCASERGGGLACWLETLRRLSERPATRTCLFIAFSGHELGLLGGRHFAAVHSATLANSPSWLHFGANLGAPGMPVKLQSSQAALAAMGASVLERAGIEVAPETEAGRPRGEAAIPHEEGIPYLAPISSSLVFHHTADRWPDAVDTVALARLADAFADVARSMAGQ